MKKLNWTRLSAKAFLPVGAALLLLILSWCFRGKDVLCAVFAVLSALVSLYGLLPQLKAAVLARDLRSGLLLLVLGAVLYACTGRIPGAAAALLLACAGRQVMNWLREEQKVKLEKCRDASPLKQELPELADASRPAAGRERFLSRYFTLLMVLLAALSVILTVLVLHRSAEAALRRAAVLLSLGGTAVFFSAFPFGELAAAITAAGQGVLFRGESLQKLSDLRLCGAFPGKAYPCGSAAVYPLLPEKLDADMLVKLASLALSGLETPWSEPLSSICEAPTGSVQTRQLEGFGAAAKVQGLTVLCGSAEFMNKAGLHVLPFPLRASILHIAVNGVYAGCIDFDESALSLSAPELALEQAGFFAFRKEQEILEQRQPGESLLLLSPAGYSEAAVKGDLPASLGAAAADAEIVIERCGNRSICELMEQLTRVRLLRRGLLLLDLGVKAVLLLLALFGVCPLWLAVVLELAAEGFGYFYSLRALDAESGF